MFLRGYTFPTTSSGSYFASPRPDNAWKVVIETYANVHYVDWDRTHAQRSQRAQHASAKATARRKNARDAVNVDETQEGVDGLQNRVDAGL